MTPEQKKAFLAKDMGRELTKTGIEVSRETRSHPNPSSLEGYKEIRHAIRRFRISK